VSLSSPEGGDHALRPVYAPLPPLEAGDQAAAGKFTVRDVLPLVYTVNLHNLPARYYLKSVRYGGKEVPRTGLVFAGEGELEIVLGGSAGVLEGSVIGRDGKPAGNAAVVLAQASGPLPPRAGTADARGYFYFGNLPPGSYSLFALDPTAPEASDPPESLQRLAIAGQTVRLGENAQEKVDVTALPTK
jgi:hypothetical protein